MPTSGKEAAAAPGGKPTARPPAGKGVISHPISPNGELTPDSTPEPAPKPATLSWADRMRQSTVNGGPAADAEKPAPPAAGAPAPAKPAPAAGVKLPIGVDSKQPSIKFGDIDPAEVGKVKEVQPASKPAPAAASAAPPAAAPAAPPPVPAAPAAPAAPPVVPPPAPPAGPKPSFAAAASSAPKPMLSAVPMAVPAPRPPGGGQRGPPGAQRAAHSPGSMAVPGAGQPGIGGQPFSPGGFPGGAYSSMAGYGVPLGTGYGGMPYGAPGQQGYMTYSPGGFAGYPPAYMGATSVPGGPQAGGAPGPGGLAAPAGGGAVHFTGAPQSPQAAAAKLPQAPVRQKKVLRIENPDTHEVLDLSAMPGSQQKATPPPSAATPPAGAKPAPAPAAATKPAPAAKPAAAAAAAPAEKPAEKPAEQKPAPANAEEPAASKAAAPADAVEAKGAAAALVKPAGAWGSGGKSFKDIIQTDAAEAKKKEQESKQHEKEAAVATAAAATAAAVVAAKKQEGAAAKQREEEAAAKREAEQRAQQEAKAAQQGKDEEAKRAAEAAAEKAAAERAAAAEKPTPAKPEAVAPAPAKPAAEAKAEGKEDVSPFSSAGPPKEDGGKEGEPSPSGYDFDKDSGRIRIRTEWLMYVKAQPQCRAPPKGLEDETWRALSWEHEQERSRSGPMRGGGMDRGHGPRGGPGPRDGPMGMRGGPGPRGGPMGAPPGGPMGRQPSGRAPRGIDGDNWQRMEPLPHAGGHGGRGPPPGMRGPPTAHLHKTENAYKLGAISSDDPEEEKAQRKLKGLLNKLTVDNFEKVLPQMVEPIHASGRAKTLQGFIDQIFDKALTETTFAELYAQLVAKLNPALPELRGEDDQPVQFRRTLLNKCQEEFMSGVVAMKAVKEREARTGHKAEDGAAEAEAEAEAEAKEAAEKKAKEEGEEGAEKEGAKAEEGEIPKDPALEARRAEAKERAREVAARRRALGNIIFVGQLYRQGVLTEQVMTQCIQQLLEETESPRPEDVECLCKLLTTIGKAMDSSVKMIKRPDGSGSDPTRDLMKIYFRRIEGLSGNQALDSRHRFMLLDLIELRRNNWVLRRKQEGPKKISQIHSDVQREALDRQRSTGLDRQSSRGGRDFPSRGPPPPARPPFDNRLDAPIRAMARGSQESLGSTSFRPGGRPAAAPREPRPAPPARHAPPASEGARPPSPPPRGAAKAAEPEPAASPEATLSEEELRPKAKGLVGELYLLKDVKEATACTKELLDKGAEPAGVVELLFLASLEGKGTDWGLFEQLLKAASEEAVVPGPALFEGVKRLLANLSDILMDVPKAAAPVGAVLGGLAAAGLLPLGELVEQVRTADVEPPPEGEDTMLVGDGHAKKVVGSLLRALAAAAGPEEAKKRWAASGAELSALLPADERESKEELAALVEEFGLGEVVG